MRQFYAYIRVSTVKQGQQGVSLQEQRDAILRYAGRSGIEITEWFEEQVTAAKEGRPVFKRMLKALHERKAEGIVIHKIDRGARNLRDWATLTELADYGIDVHLANESLDIRSRSGRLSADIQAVVATDYIRNLREETIKGLYGRLKQGIYPFAAPLGYVNNGAGNVKTLHPVIAPLVRKTFELYATGKYNVERLVEEMHVLGLRSRTGKKVGLSTMYWILNNTFYMGLITIQRNGQVYEGKHPPLIPKSVFDRVQTILAEKTNTRPLRHDLLFRRMLSCQRCGYTLIGEVQKGHHYYRCHTKTCPMTTVREEIVESQIERFLETLALSDEEKRYCEERLHELKIDWVTKSVAHAESMAAISGKLQDRMRRLTDVYVDGALDRETFETRKKDLLMEMKASEETLNEFQSNQTTIPDKVAGFLELASTALLTYRMGIPEERRDLLKKLTSNRVIDGKNLCLSLHSPFEVLLHRSDYSLGALGWNRTNINGLEVRSSIH